MSDPEEHVNRKPPSRGSEPTADMPGPRLETGTQIGHFQVEREIGHGGTGVVYLAHDTTLDRHVAIKSLPLELMCDAHMRSRLKREAKLLASLDHPNIATIHDIVEHEEGGGYLILEYVPGQTLAEQIAKGPLKLGEALAIALQIAEAVAAAHEHDVIHRDLKPGNIKITPEDKVKVLDFGLAKVVGGKATDQQTTITEPGRVIGTPAYMSPEQARGKPTDKRCDIWSFGCVLYEMLSGRVPFKGDTISDTLAAILEHEPNWQDLPENTPTHIRVLLHHCLDKAPRRRLRDMGDIAITLEDTVAELRQPGSHSALSESTASSATGWRRPIHAWPVAGAAVGILVLLAFMAGLTLRRSSEKEKRQLGLPPAVESIRAIAVLPFENLSADAEQEYFVDGMTDELSAELGKVSALTVKGQYSAKRYKSTDKSIPEIAKELGVDAVIKGSVLKADNDVRITVYLADGKTDAHLWSDNYTGTLSNILSLQSQVTLAIAREIEAAITPEEEARITRTEAVNPEAYEAYLLGRHYYSSGLEQDLKMAIEYFDQALEIDSTYGLAYAGLANTYGVLGGFNILPPEDTWPNVRSAAEKALAIDEGLAEAHNSLAAVKTYYEWDWSGAEREFKRALEINPNSVNAHVDYSSFLHAMERYGEALSQIERALELDPHSFFVKFYRALALYYAGQKNEAIQLAKDEIDSDPDQVNPLWYWCLANVYAGQGRYEEALAPLRTQIDLMEADVTDELGFLGYLYGRLGRKAEALEQLEALDELAAQGRYVSPVTRSLVYIGLDDKDKAFACLEKGYQAHSAWMCLLKAEFFFDSLRDDPWFANLLRKMNFPEAPDLGTTTERKETAQGFVKHFVVLPHTKIADEALWHVALAISPDGNRLAYADQGDGPERMLYVQELDRFEATPIPGTEGAIDPFFSPDGQWLGYSDHNRHTLQLVAIGGGNPRRLAKAIFFGGATWLDDMIVYSPDSNDGLWSVPIDGGSPARLTTPDSGSGETWHAWPSTLPNGDILFTTYIEREGVRSMQLEQISLDDRVRRTLLKDAEHGRYLSSGHLVFVRNSSLFAVRFDPKKNRLAGTPIPLPQRVLYQPAIGAVQFSCSETGLLAWIAAPKNRRQLVWVNDRGQVKPLEADDRAYEMASVSSDGSFIAAAIAGQHSQRDVNSDIWIGEMSRGTWKQVTFDGLSTSPQWLNGSRELLYLQYSLSDPRPKLISLDPSGRRDERIVAAQLPEFAFLGYCVHPAGTHVLSTTALPDNNQDIVSIDLNDDELSPESVVGETRLQRGPTLSPDGRWLAYSSNETGTWEVYVRPFPNPGAKMPVSRGGGYEPLWHPAGNRLYYRNGDEMWMVRYEAEAEFVPGPPEFLFDRHFYGGILADSRTYAVTEDDRFLMIQEDSVPGSRINLTVNWFEELKGLLP